jgi:hypothetical protein
MLSWARANLGLRDHPTAQMPVPRYPCDWCGHVSNRRDNWIAHLKLHTKQRPETGGSKPRRKYIPGAVLQLQAVLKEIRGRRRGATKPKERSCSPA